MNINTLNTDYIEKTRNKSIKNNKSISDIQSWIHGWESAIKFAKRVDKAIWVCEHCGKLIYDTENVYGIEDMICEKCYKKLTKEYKDVSTNK